MSPGWLDSLPHDDKGVASMSILGRIAQIGIAKKVIDQARKPESQAKLKRGVEQAKTYVAKRKGGS